MSPLEPLKTARSHIQTRKSQTVAILGRSVTDTRIGTRSTFNDCYQSTGCTEDTAHRRSPINAEWKPEHSKLANKTVARGKLAETETQDIYSKVFWSTEYVRIRHCTQGNERDEGEEFDWNSEDAGQRDGKTELLWHVTKHSHPTHRSHLKDIQWT